MYGLGQYEASCYVRHGAHPYFFPPFLVPCRRLGIIPNLLDVPCNCYPLGVTRAAIDVYTKRDAPNAAESLCPPRYGLPIYVGSLGVTKPNHVTLWFAPERDARSDVESREPVPASADYATKLDARARRRNLGYPTYLNAANLSLNPCCSGSSMAAAYRASTSSGAPDCGPARSRAPVADG